MNAAMDELVEKAARSASVAVVGNESLYADWVRPMRAALEAVGLPALLERVEAAERRPIGNSEMAPLEPSPGEARRRTDDALAAKVARVEAVIGPPHKNLDPESGCHHCQIRAALTGDTP